MKKRVLTLAVAAMLGFSGVMGGSAAAEQVTHTGVVKAESVVKFKSLDEYNIYEDGIADMNKKFDSLKVGQKFGYKTQTWNNKGKTLTGSYDIYKKTSATTASFVKCGQNQNSSVLIAGGTFGSDTFESAHVKFTVNKVEAYAFKGDKKSDYVVIGKNIKVLAPNAFSGMKKLSTIVLIQRPKLTKKNIKGCLKGCKVKNIQADKKDYNACKKIWTKKNTGNGCKANLWKGQTQGAKI